MRKLLVLLILGTALWSGYWFFGSNAVRNGAEDWFANAAAQGLVAEKSSLTVAGYPNRFDLTVTDLRLSDPAGGTGWQAPFVQVFAMTWKPWHIIAALPPSQVVTLPDQEITVTSEGLRASFRAKPATDVPLAAVILESGPFKATSTAGWTTGAARAVASISADEEVPGAGDAPNAYVLSLDLGDLTPDPAATQTILADSGLPPVIATVRILVNATTTAPLDRHAGDTNPRLATLSLRDLSVIWGDLSVSAAGDIAPDQDGYAAGRIDIAVTNWQPLVPAMVAAGAVKPELAQTVQTMLTALARDTGDENVLKLPLVLQDGRMSLGPVPLGPAPQMVPPSG
ncbi:MAG: DUF2125 domain-containing protein [Tabrizicola sp.]|jgi:hypothetical protein|nr:DUF2125 domain-containing protein [Tabrizicola sp.]